MKRWLCRCLVVAVALLLVAAGCSDSDGGDGDAVEASASPEVTVVPDAEVTGSTAATTAAPDDVTPADEVQWATAELDAGVRDLRVFGSSLVGIAEQSFNVPMEDGCADFAAGRSGEVVWSRDGLTWEGLASQPLWYDGPVTVEQLEEGYASGEAPSDEVALLVHEDQVFAVSSRSGGQPDGVIVEVWDESSETWERVPGTEGVVRGGGTRILAAAGPAGLVVVATGVDGEPMLWTLGGGEMVSVEDPALDSEQLYLAASTGGFALGASTDGFLAQDVRGGGQIVLLRSDDGREWTEVTDAPTSALTEIATRAGVVLGVAGSGAALMEEEELWRSDDDGRTWELDRSVPNEAIAEIAVGAQGWALWTLTGAGLQSSPESVHFSSDGLRWQRIGGLSADDVDWATGLAVTDDGVVVVTSHLPGGGWVCPQVEATTYHARLAEPTP